MSFSATFQYSSPSSSLSSAPTSAPSPSTSMAAHAPSPSMPSESGTGELVAGACIRAARCEALGVVSSSSSRSGPPSAAPAAGALRGRTSSAACPPSSTPSIPPDRSSPSPSSSSPATPPTRRFFASRPPPSSSSAAAWAPTEGAFDGDCCEPEVLKMPPRPTLTDDARRLPLADPAAAAAAADAPPAPSTNELCSVGNLGTGAGSGSGRGAVFPSAARLRADRGLGRVPSRSLPSGELLPPPAADASGRRTSSPTPLDRPTGAGVWATWPKRPAPDRRCEAEKDGRPPNSCCCDDRWRERWSDCVPQLAVNGGRAEGRLIENVAALWFCERGRRDLGELKISTEERERGRERSQERGEGGGWTNLEGGLGPPCLLLQPAVLVPLPSLLFGRVVLRLERVERLLALLVRLPSSTRGRGQRAARQGRGRERGREEGRTSTIRRRSIDASP